MAEFYTQHPDLAPKPPKPPATQAEALRREAKSLEQEAAQLDREESGKSSHAYLSRLYSETAAEMAACERMISDQLKD
jgi:hypothetical protein